MARDFVLIVAAVGAAALIGIYMKKNIIDKSLPRAVRNNNPLNIRISAANDWQGELPEELNKATDSEFESFFNPVAGYRAAVIVLRNYQKKYGLFTLNDIINRFAPTVENNTNAYVNAVSDFVGVLPNDVINLFDDNTMLQVLLAMHKHEAGGIYFGEKLALKGIQAAA